MAINDGNTIDPSRRIRAVLGEEFTANVEADALNRIVSQANVEGNVKSNNPTGPVRNDKFDASDYVNRIVHSNSTKVGVNGVKPHPVTNASRNEALNKTFMQFKSTIMMEDRPKSAKVVMKLTGFDKAKSRAENITNAGCALANVSTGVALQYISDSYLHKSENFNTKNILGVSIVGSLVDFASSYWFSGNKDTVEGLFDPNNISSAEADLINKAINKEKFKYAAEHVGFGFIAPFAASNAFNKFLPEKAKNNNVVKVLTSFGTLSAVSKTVLQSVRNFKDIKDLKSIDGCSYSITEGQPCEAYEIIAKYATRKSINGQLDSSIYGNIGGVAVTSISNMIKNKKVAGNTEVVKSVDSPKIELVELPVKKETVKNEKATA